MHVASAGKEKIFYCDLRRQCSDNENEQDGGGRHDVRDYRELRESLQPLQHRPEAKEILEEARAAVADVIGAQPQEILFTSGGSEADNQAILSAAALGRKNGKMHCFHRV